MQKQNIIAAFKCLPADCRSPRASDSALRAFESEFGPVPPDFRWFLAECGGGTIGSEWVDNVEELATTHRKFAAESQLPNGWSMQGVFVIGWDGAGNPFGIESSSARIVVRDHDAGGIHVMAESLGQFFENGLLA